MSAKGLCLRATAAAVCCLLLAPAASPAAPAPCRDGELSAVGDYPNQGAGNEGLDLYANGQSVNNRDVVVWWTAGFTHRPRVEDFPSCRAS